MPSIKTLALSFVGTAVAVALIFRVRAIRDVVVGPLA